MSATLIIALAALVALGVFVALAASGAGSGTHRLPSGSGRRARDQQFDGERLTAAATSATGSPSTRAGARRITQAQHLSDRLIAAGIKLRPSEFRGIQVAFALTLGAVGALRFGQVIPATIMAAAGWFAPWLYLRQRQGRMRSVINTQLTETLTTLANSLKAGLNLPQALDAVARAGFHPLSDEFARVVREMSMGATIEQALTNLVRRTQNEDLELAVTAILIHNTIGGNLASVLDSIEKTIRTRVAIASELATLTAQTRASAWVITLLPIGVATLLLFMAPSYFTPMVTSTFGRILLLGCGLSILVGNLLIRRLTRAEV